MTFLLSFIPNMCLIRKWILLILVSMTQMSTISARNYIVKHFNANNGLISASNGSLYQDSTGFIWQCSFGGLVRFDGTQFKSFDNSDGLSHYHVTDIFEKRRNQFIICNNFKLFSFDGNTFKTIHTNLPGDLVYERLTRLSHGEILLRTDQGYYKSINDSTYQRFEMGQIPSGDILYLHEYLPGKIIFYRRDTRQLYHIIDGKTEDVLQLNKTDALYGIHEIDSMPFISLSKRMCIIRNHRLENYLPPQFTGSPYITSIYRDRKKNLWFTDADFHLWNMVNGQLTDMGNKYQIARINLPQYIEDRNNNLLVDYINGLYVFRESLFEEVPMKELNGYNTYFLSSFYGQDTLCFGISKNKLTLIAGGRRVTKAIQTGPYIDFEDIRNCSIHATRIPNTYFLYVRKNGLYYLKNNVLLPFHQHAADFSKISLSAVYDSVTNAYYAGIPNKVLRITETKIDSIDLSAYGQGLMPHSYQIMKDGSLYFLATHKYLFHLKGDHLENVTAQLQLDGKEISLFSHHGALWVLVHGIEIREYQLDHERLNLHQCISKKNGLLDANANAILFDDQDHLWINAFTGLYFLQNHKKDTGGIYYSKKIPLHIGNKESPMLDHINYNHQGLYTVGDGGVLIVSTGSALLETQPIKTYFTSIRFNGQELNQVVTEVISGLHKEYTFPSSYTTLNAQVSTVYYGYDDAILYQYKLEGQDEEWKTLFRSNQINYSNLTNGSYTLKVRSTNQIKKTNYTEASFAFVIQPPYYKTWWARLLLAICTIGLIIYIILVRDKYKHKENKIAMQLSELKLEALQSQMNPHFIFNALNSIQNYIVNNNQIEAARYLSKFSKLIRKTLDNSHHQFIPLEEIIQSLEMYLALEAFRFNSEFTYTINVDDADDRIFTLELPPMLLQPFVENAILHGLMPKNGSKVLTVLIYIRENNLHCIIEDNGVGRSAKIKPEGHSSRGQKLIEGMLDSMKHLKMCEPKINFTDKTDEQGSPSGTIVDLIIPIEM